MSLVAKQSTVRWLAPFLADLACVLVFALAGKASHDGDESDSALVLAIAWPFALAVACAHCTLILRGRATSRLWPEGVLVFAVTYALGMLLRAVSGRGLAPAFLVVAALFLALTMLGWRGIVRLDAKRREAREST
ncbi:MAG TPA: DUF3054 domain-containing protein [Nocardioidaceae bacterium]|nr:DUF3054 domain-containing protein [Nocardioidaceae bacterium]